MPVGTILHFFAEGVKPLWEDEACAKGGRITIRLPKTHSAKYWEDLLLAMVGEQFSLEGEVLGLVLSLKFNGDSIALWHRSSSPEVIDTLKAEIHKFVSIDPAMMKVDNEIFQEVLSQPKPTYQPSRGRGAYRGRGRGTRGGGVNADGTPEDNTFRRRPAQPTLADF